VKAWQMHKNISKPSEQGRARHRKINFFPTSALSKGIFQVKKQLRKNLKYVL